MYRLWPTCRWRMVWRSHGLARDPEVIRAYTSDPLVHDKISARSGWTCFRPARGLWSMPASSRCPCCWFTAAPTKSRRRRERRSLPPRFLLTARSRLWDGLYHETHNEPEKAEVLAFMIDWLRKHTLRMMPTCTRGVDMSSLLITHGQVFTLGQRNELIPDGAIFIEGDTIAEVGSTAALAARYPAPNGWTPAASWCCPGSVCGHTHFYGAFARGMAIPGAPATNFVEILERLWWKLDRALLWDDVRYSALVCLVDAIRHGTTTLIDHHASPNVIDGSLDIIAEAVKEAGLRASLCYEVTDRNGMEGARPASPRTSASSSAAAASAIRSWRRHSACTPRSPSPTRRWRHAPAAAEGPGHRLSHPRRRGHRRPGREPAQVRPARGRATAELRDPRPATPSPSTASTWMPTRRTSCAKPAPW